MTPEEFAAKWEVTTSGGWTICGGLEKDRHGWNVMLRQNDTHVGMACFNDGGDLILSYFTVGAGNLVPRKVQRWVTRDELKDGMRIVRTGFKPVGGLVVMEPCIRWNDGSLANVASYGSLDTFLIEEPA